LQSHKGISMIQEPRLDHLYQEVILDHNRRPRNFKQIPEASQYSHGVNPLCGDDYHLYLIINGESIVQDVGFQGSGCAISKASASMMTSLIKGKNVKDVLDLKNGFIDFMTKEEISQATRSTVGRLSLFEGVREFPVRIKCATLIWHALNDAVQDLPSSSFQ